MPHSRCARRVAIALLAAAMTVAAGCAAPGAPGPVALVGSQQNLAKGKVQVDLTAFRTQLARRRVQGLGFFEPDITAYRITVTGPGLEEPVAITLDIPDPVVLSVDEGASDEEPPADEEPSLTVEAGPNRIVTVEGLDEAGHVLAAQRGVGPVVANGTTRIAVNAHSDAAARVVGHMLASSQGASRLAGADVTASLQAFIDSLTGAEGPEAYDGVNPVRFRARVLADYLTEHGFAVLTASEPDTALMELLAAEASANCQAKVLVDGEVQVGETVRVTVFDPYSGGPKGGLDGVFAFGALPPGTWAVRAEVGEQTRWTTVEVPESGEVALAIAMDEEALPAPEFAWVTTLAGAAEGLDDGRGAEARFDGPRGITLGANGQIYVADYFNENVRRIDPVTQAVTVFAGSPTGDWGTDDGTGTDARFDFPTDIAVQPGTNLAYVVAGSRIARVDLQTAEVQSLTLVDETGTAIDFGDEEFDGVAVDASGTIYVSDLARHRILKVSPREAEPLVAAVTHVAGSLIGESGMDDGAGADARFHQPAGLAVDSEQRVLYVADGLNGRVRTIDLATGGVGTLAEGQAPLSEPTGLALGPDGWLYVADYGADSIWRVNPLTRQVVTVAGPDYGDSDGHGDAAEFGGPMRLVVSPAGQIYVTDRLGDRIRLVSLFNVKR